MKKEIVSILTVFLLLLVNITAISEDAQTSKRDSDEEKFPLSPDFGKPLPIFKVRHRKNIHMAMRRALFPERRYHLGEEVFEKFQRYSLQTPKTFSSGKSNNSIKENKPSKGKTIYVPDDYETIQEAVGHAQPGDTIIVRDGTYVENVVINKPYLTIKSENGPENCIVKAESDDDPVFLICGNYTTLTGFTIMDGQFGIRLLHSSNNIIMNNTISNNEWDGIRLSFSSNNIITNNGISNNGEDGILSYYSSNNIIMNNTISNNEWDGVGLVCSSNNQITNNTFIKDGISVSYSYRNTIEGNTVNGKPLVYLEGETNVEIEDAGQVILVNCSDIEVKNLNLSNTDIGIELWSSKNCRIESNVISNNGCGIELDDSSNNIIMNNTISNNSCGAHLDGSSNNRISNNTFIKDGISVSYSYQNIIEGNTVNGKPLVYLEGETGVRIENAGQVILVNCSDIEVKNLNLSNTDVGIELLNSKNCKIKSNIILNNGGGIWLHNSSNNIITNNIISNNGCGIYLDSSSNNIIMNNTISNNKWDGICLDDASNNIIANNTISNNKCDGIHLSWYSSRNTITDNIISNNGWIGIWLSDSSNGNIIFLNSFEKNAKYNAWDWGKDYWDNGTIGNYWDDYRGRDTDGDGIGDTPYPIRPYYTLNFDYYPIVKGATQNDTNPPEVIIDKPRKGYLYILNSEFRPTPWGRTVIIGDIDIKVTVRDWESGIYSVTFYIDNEPAYTEYAHGQEYFKQYSYTWDKTAFGKHKIKVVAYDRTFNVNSTELTVFIINFHPHLPWLG